MSGWCLEAGANHCSYKKYKFPLVCHPYLRVAGECVWMTSTYSSGEGGVHSYTPPTAINTSALRGSVWVTSTVGGGAFTATHRHLKESVEVLLNLKIKKSIVKINLQI